MKKLSLLAVLLGFNIALGACSDDETPDVKNELFQLPEKAYVLAEQFRRAIVIRDAVTQHNIWSWDPYTACVPAAQQGWFVNPSEVKPVFNRRYILMTASGGAVALIRISDHKLMFYANCGQNPHSAEILPDGNIVTAESKSGEINTFVVDTVKVLGAKANTLKSVMLIMRYGTEKDLTFTLRVLLAVGLLLYSDSNITVIVPIRS